MCFLDHSYPEFRLVGLFQHNSDSSRKFRVGARTARAPVIASDAGGGADKLSADGVRFRRIRKSSGEGDSIEKKLPRPDFEFFSFRIHARRNCTPRSTQKPQSILQCVNPT